MKIQTFDTSKKIFLIAEIGNNHEGSFSLAKKLILLAKKNGADAVKFQYIKPENVGETILLNAIKAPFETILHNAGIENYDEPNIKGNGIDVISGGGVDMVSHGIIDPLLVTKTALKNAISVVSTIISANCVISNIRVNESS